MEVLVVDYGLGNLKSIERALTFNEHDVLFCSNPQKVENHPMVLLPGVGAFEKAMENLTALGLVEAIRSRHENQMPFLGICLGMQLMFESSEEGKQSHAGLGLIPGSVHRIPSSAQNGNLRAVPHVGWNRISWDKAKLRESQTLIDSALLEDAYFTHSFFAQPDDPSSLLAKTNVGALDVCAVAADGLALGFQFHPEKSGFAGVRFLSAALNGLASEYL